MYSPVAEMHVVANPSNDNVLQTHARMSSYVIRGVIYAIKKKLL